MISEVVLRQIQDNMELIDHEEWQSVYRNVILSIAAEYAGEHTPWLTYIGEFTNVILECGVNPLDFMTVVPLAFFYGQQSDSAPNIREGIIEIREHSFVDCKNIKQISIPSSVVKIGSEAFSGCTGIEDIYYNGTKDKFLDISFGWDWLAGPKKVTIHCKDGDLISAYNDKYKQELKAV